MYDLSDKSIRIYKIIEIWKYSEKKTYLRFSFFTYELILWIKNIFSIWYMVYFDKSEIFLMIPSEFKISISVKSSEEKIAENYRNCYVVEKLIVSKLLKILIPYFDKQKLKTLLKMVSKFYVPIFHSFQKINFQIAIQSGRVWPVHRFKLFS